MYKYWCSILSLFFIASLLPTNHGYNVDTVNYIIHNGTRNSMFGFSIALHKENGRSSAAGTAFLNKTIRTQPVLPTLAKRIDPQKKWELFGILQLLGKPKVIRIWVIVGAPKTDTSYFQRGVIEGGAVFQCDTRMDHSCNIIKFDEQGHTMNKQHQMDTKSHQWFGATVVSAGIDGPVLACAPRYVWHMPWPPKEERIEPVGTCFMATNDFRNFSEYSPCRTIYWGYHRQGSCQAGLSASLTKDGERFFIGAPGSWYWQGQIYAYDTRAISRYSVFSTSESTAFEDYSYKGYSMATGDFNGDGEQGVAVGMPRGGGLLGKVLIYNWKMENQQNITGEQIGSYFGYSICSVDVDGDGFDDIVVGAPMYTEPNNEGKYEVGRVYVIYQEETDKFQSLHSRDGFESKGRFGLSLCSLKDINLDGYGDFAVGAPYDGPNGEGVVYIYHGSAKGIREKPSQIIKPSNVFGLANAGMRTFGFALSGAVDIDDNDYPDMVIGAYESDNVFLFRSRPVARIEATTSFLAENKLISLENKTCRTVRDNKEVPCTTIVSCLRYNGINLPERIDLAVSWVLDSRSQRTPRMFFLMNEGRNIHNTTITLFPNRLECRNETVYLMDNIRDKLTPLEVEMHYALRPLKGADAPKIRNPRSVLAPVIDENYGIMQKDSINIQKNCGSDNICIPNLSLNINMVDKYLLGSKKPFVIEVLITNSGDDAFEAGFYMNIPKLLDFKRIERLGDLRDTPLSCSVVNNENLKCDLGNPLQSRKVQKFNIVLSASQKAGMQPAYQFFLEVNSTNPEMKGDRDDNLYSKNVSVWISTDLTIEGNSIPQDLLYNGSNYNKLKHVKNELGIGPQVVHAYNIRNHGPSSLEEAIIYLLVPTETQSGDELFYILNEPETSGNLYCDPVFSNIYNLELDEYLSKKSYLRQIGAISKQHPHSDAVAGGKPGGGISVSSHNGTGGEINTGYVYTPSKEEQAKLDRERDKPSPGDPSFEHEARIREEMRKQAERREQWMKTWGGSRVGKISFLNGTHLSDGTPYRDWRFGAEGSRDAIKIANRSHLSNGLPISFWNNLWDSGRLKLSGANLKIVNKTHLSDGTLVRDWNEHIDKHFGPDATLGRINFWNGTYLSDGTPVENWHGQSYRTEGSNIASVSIDGKAFDTWMLQDGGSFKQWLEKWYQSSGLGGVGSGGLTTTTWSNSSYTSDGSKPGVVQYWNKTTITRPDGSVHVVESSTEFYGGGSYGYGTGGSGHVSQGNQHGQTGGSYHVSQGSHQGQGGGGSYHVSQGSQQGQGAGGSFHGSQGGGGTYHVSQSGQSGGGSYHTSQSGQSVGGTYHVQQGGSQGDGSVTYQQGGNVAIAGIGGSRDRPRPMQTYEQSFRGGTGGQGTYQQGQTSHHSNTGTDGRFFGNQGTVTYTQSEGGGRSQSGGATHSQSEGFTHTQSSGGTHSQSGGFNAGAHNYSGSFTHSQAGEGTYSQFGGQSGGFSNSQFGSSTHSQSGVGTSSHGSHGSSGQHSTSHGKVGRIEDIFVEGTVSKDLLENQGSQTHVEKDGRRRMKSQQDGEPYRPGLVTGAVALEESRTGGSAQVGVLDLGVLGGSNTIESENFQSGQAGSQSRGSFSVGGRGSSSGQGSNVYTSGGQGGTRFSTSWQESSSGRQGGQGAYNAHYTSGGQRSQSTGGQTSSQYSSGGPFQTRSGGGQRFSTATTSRFHGESNDNDGFYDDESIDGDYIVYDDSDSETNDNKRHRREAKDKTDAEILKEALNCYPFKCTVIQCKTGPLANDEGVWIAVRTRLAGRTLHKLSGNVPVKLSTMMVAHVVRLPFVGEPEEKPIKTHEIFVTAEPEKTPKSDIVPLWVVVVSACAGAIILLLLIFLLYKCGFFKRERPETSQERQPLNRNGGYHGDEHL